MRTIAITRTDGGVSIMRILRDTIEVPEGEDPDVAWNTYVTAEITKWEASGFTAVRWEEIQDVDLPASRVNRNAWEVTP